VGANRVGLERRFSVADVLRELSGDGIGIASAHRNNVQIGDVESVTDVSGSRTNDRIF
jgi:hypothetical protein